MKTLENLKNTYSQEQGYDDWEAFLNYYGGRHPEWFDQHWQEICIRAQKALKHPIYTRIDHYKELAEKHKDDAYNNRKYTYKAAGLEDALRIITNPENLIRTNSIKTDL